jgi:hypothetical protein
MTFEALCAWLAASVLQAQPSPDEWLAALDDCLVHRLVCCTSCGQRGGPDMKPGIWDVQSEPRNVAFAVCPTCASKPDWKATLDALLRWRYHPDRFPHSP